MARRRDNRAVNRGGHRSHRSRGGRPAAVDTNRANNHHSPPPAYYSPSQTSGCESGLDCTRDGCHLWHPTPSACPVGPQCTQKGCRYWHLDPRTPEHPNTRTYKKRMESLDNLIASCDPDGDGDVLMITAPAGGLRWGRDRHARSRWQDALKPFTKDYPLPDKLVSVLDQSFNTLPEHRPAVLNLTWNGIPDLVQYRDKTSCFVCANLCDSLIQKAHQFQQLNSPTTPKTRAFRLVRGMAYFEQNVPLLKLFLQDVNRAIQQWNSDRLGQLLTVDPSNDVETQVRMDLRDELRRHAPKGHEYQLEAAVEKSTPNDWPQLKPVVLGYLRLIRDTDSYSMDDRSQALMKIADQSIIALGDSTSGDLILPTVLNLSRRLAQVVSTRGNDVIVEECANTLRDAFIKCLVGGGIGKAAHETRPQSKRTGIYLTANACLRLLFQCRKLRNAQQMFVSIDAQSPFLSFYPRAQRVSYLFYLGRYHFANSHFYRSQLCLQTAYETCHRQAISHRKHILTYLMAANICLGRFPSAELLSRPEASPASAYFQTLCKIITVGDLGSFNRYLDLDNTAAQWFLRKGILLQLRNRCEVLVWRSLIRQTFKYAGFQPVGGRLVPYLRLSAVRHAARFSLGRRNTRPSSQSEFRAFGQPFQPRDEDLIDPEFHGLDDAVNETGFDFDTSTYHDENIGQHQHSIFSNGTNEDNQAPSIPEIESIMASLIQQGFLKGFLTHNNPRFAIPGAKERGPLAVGFPNVWEVIKNREEDTVPGWVRESEHKPGLNVFGGGMRTGAASGGGGRVVNLSGARPVGAGT